MSNSQDMQELMQSVDELKAIFAEFSDGMKNFVKIIVDDPLNAVKWILVFAVLVGSFILMIKVTNKLGYLLSYERKRDIARSRGHVITAHLQRTLLMGTDGKFDARGIYTYTLGDKEYTHRVTFKRTRRANNMVYLYYIDNPRHVFSYEGYHWQDWKGIIFLPLMLSPLFVTAFFAAAIQLNFPGAPWL